MPVVGHDVLRLVNLAVLSIQLRVPVAEHVETDSEPALQRLRRHLALAVLGAPALGVDLNAGAHAVPWGRPVGVWAPQGVLPVR